MTPELISPAVARRTGVLHTALRTPGAVVGGAVVVLLLLVAVAGPLLVPHSPTEPVPGGLAAAFAPPSLDHPLGLDGQGRDVLSRMIAGTRLTLAVGISAVLVGALIGTLVGAVAGSVGGVVDNATMRVVDLLLAFPSLLLALGIVAAFGQGRTQVVIAVGVTTVPVFARLVRSEVQRQTGLDYVSAARMYGSGRGRILLRHLIPNSAHLIVVQATLMLSTTVIEVAALGYLGLGPADPREAEWGSMLTEATLTMRTEPQLLVWPSIALVITAVAFNVLGDGLRHAVEED
ncbi:ABC transporter permease [Jiangella anatolica]|uniref:ABC transporter permease n=1 Tax=Jiangella anatolica TaxID=2670374 RepID=A0A2W2B785_9ACTN|nr:ABC transporter permease [Jiangella anatolica]PZF81922.1 ABC transporter permease [Jiangella anatolica]